ncbi:MAG: hypothetical protein AAF748_07775 [Pseudomonadota bacterium]
MIQTILKRFLVMLTLTAGFATSAQAAELQWSFDNESNGRISIKFFSDVRDWEWPGNNQVYYVDPRDGVRTMTLSCNQGERICYGAWLDSNPNYIWGVGRTGNSGCRSCCYVCGGGRTETIELISN